MKCSTTSKQKRKWANHIHVHIYDTHHQSVNCKCLIHCSGLLCKRT